ncbi:hypothetical protein BVX98_04055, partial [bacterium F11]
DLLGPPADSLSFRNPLFAFVMAQMTHGDIYVKGTIRTILTFQCARCLNEFDKPFEGQFSQAFKPELDMIDVKNEIRETVLVDLPIKPLCQVNCKGICPQCGTDMNNQECHCSQKTVSKLNINIPE